MSFVKNYLDLINKSVVVPSIIYAYIPDDDEFLDTTKIVETLNSSHYDVEEIKDVFTREKKRKWELEVHIGQDEEKIVYNIWLEQTEELSSLHYDNSSFTDDEKSAIKKSLYAIGVETEFGEDLIEEFHEQMKITHLIVENPSAVLDAAACRLHSTTWFKSIVTSKTPPDPSNLFTIHAVEDDESGDYWLHTHGLIRCGMPELEMMGVENDIASNLGQLIQTVAVLAFSIGFPHPDMKIEPVEGVKIVWLPWENGIGYYPESQLGGFDDRDEYHTAPSGILFKKRGFFIFKKYLTPNEYGSLMKNNPLLQVSSDETERMRQLAKEKWSVFDNYFAEYGSSEDWMFLVKLGYDIDNSEDSSDKEHLWFQVLEKERSRLKAKLLNAPYRIARMKEQDVDWHSKELLTDWLIMCKHGKFSPDTVSLLLKKVKL